jgi:pyridinium-3,5-biscarboxylic acid mononucleotide sulfurtransferase
MTDISTLYDSLLLDIADSAAASGLNCVAYSGGLDSTLVAKALYDVYPGNSIAMMALSPSVSTDMRQTAEKLAAHIGIPLQFVSTHETSNPDYVKNEGMSCYHCKTGIYEAMKAVWRSMDSEDVLLFNGTNADDIQDPTRVGLDAAREHRVRSPLSRFSKDEIRLMCKLVGLPNWNAAASPCLRSRLYPGVPATEEHLRRIELAENAVRNTFRLRPEHNLRVRHLPDDSAMIEVDVELLDGIDLGQCRPALMTLGFTDIGKRVFRSGAAAAADTTATPE